MIENVAFIDERNIMALSAFQSRFELVTKDASYLLLHPVGGSWVDSAGEE